MAEVKFGDLPFPQTQVRSITGMEPNHEQDDGVDKIDQAESFLAGITGFLNGIPLFWAAVIGGFHLGCDHTTFLGSISEAWLDLFAGGFAFVALPTLIVCFLLLLFTETPKISIGAVAFITSAWSAWSHHTGGMPRTAVIAVVSVVLYLFCVHPVVREYRQEHE